MVLYVIKLECAHLLVTITLNAQIAWFPASSSKTYMRGVDPSWKKPVVTAGPLTSVTVPESSVAVGAVHDALPNIPPGMLTTISLGQLLTTGSTLSANSTRKGKQGSIISKHE